MKSLNICDRYLLVVTVSLDTSVDYNWQKLMSEVKQRAVIAFSVTERGKPTCTQNRLLNICGKVNVDVSSLRQEALL